MRLQRANLDATWILTLGGRRLLIDPWLVGSEVDGHPLFSEQWHVHACMAPGDVGPIDAIVLSQPFDDHCHRATLERLPKVPILAVPAADDRLTNWGFASERRVRISDTDWGALQLHHLRPSALDPTHGALRLEGADGSVLIAPHGLRASTPVAPVDVLLVTHTTYALPFFLGGTVNLGDAAAQDLARRTGARRVIDTHSEPKRARGLVAALARPTYSTVPPTVECWTDLDERSFDL
jgi:L-ascorbate metabolism protein UlaG (beta-lactamase superfamily)